MKVVAVSGNHDFWRRGENSVEAWIGIDIGGTSVKTAVVSSDGHIVDKRSFDTDPSKGLDDFCIRLKRTLDSILDDAGMTWSEVHGIGAGVPGFLDLEAGVVVEAVNLGWKNMPLVERLKDTLGLPVAMENDANVAALGEAWLGAGRGASCVLCVTVGTGVGGGLVFDGKLHRGVNGMAGEIGHLVVDKGGYHCNCGLHGCLETVSSASAIIRNAKTAQEQGRLPKTEIAGAEDVFKLASDGHEAAQQVVRDAANWLGYGLSLCAVTVNPDAIVIGGGVSKAGELWMTPVREAFAENSLALVTQAANIQVAELGNDAGVIGAARLVAQKVRG